MKAAQEVIFVIHRAMLPYIQIVHCLNRTRIACMRPEVQEMA